LRENQQNNPFLRENQLFFHHFLAKIAQNLDKIFNHFSRKSSKNMIFSDFSLIFSGFLRENLVVKGGTLENILANLWP